MAENTELKRGLKERHISMIALGGAIGTGIFLAMGDSIHTAGAGGALVAYAAIGVMVYFLITSLGEMATFMPISGSFGVYATEFVDPAFGFAMGWNYWYNWAITIATELVAGALIMKFWFPHVPGIVWSAVFLVIIVALNVLSAKAYGEAEFWFAGIKVVTVLVFLVVGVLMIVGIIGGPAIGFKNVFADGGPFVGGGKAIISIFFIAGFSFQGTELIGIAAGESEEPEKNIPKAVHTIFWRILIFYMGTIIVLGCILSAKQAGVETSPFTMVFEKVGIAGAASLMNAVILTSVLSAGNSGMYASSRMLHSMALDGMAPKIFAKTNKRGVPINAIILTTVVACACLLTGFYSENLVYLWLVAASGLAGFIAWLGIAVCHYRFRKAYVAQGRSVDDLPFKAKWYPLGPVLAFVLCAVVILGQGLSYVGGGKIQWMGFISSYIGIPLFLIFLIGYKIVKKTKMVPLLEVDLNKNRLEKYNKK